MATDHGALNGPSGAGPAPGDIERLVAAIASFITVPATTGEYDALWQSVCSDGAPDPTPYGMGYDHCPYCGQDWKQPHREDCPSPYAS